MGSQPSLYMLHKYSYLSNNCPLLTAMTVRWLALQARHAHHAWFNEARRVPTH